MKKRIVPPMPIMEDTNDYEGDDVWWPIEEDQCRVTNDGYDCTREKGHYGDHVGGWSNGSYDPKGGRWPQE